ncbi:30S ribosomal protein S15 [Candidatus Woesearchaeota archaeon]|nr:30S ribosomal protein S15 [Candidatus Woesearchaeota archaeon]
MAKMHSRGRGKSGSKKPAPRKLTWVRYKPKEVELLIVKLSKSGKMPSEIGIILRDSYGIPDVRPILNKRITKVLEDNKLVGEIPEDLTALIKRQIKIMKHREFHKKDQTSKRGLILTESKIHRLVKYYKKTGRLPKEWKYDSSKARLVIG